MISRLETPVSVAGRTVVVDAADAGENDGECDRR
jgi:hypothetical protein